MVEVQVDLVVLMVVLVVLGTSVLPHIGLVEEAMVLGLVVMVVLVAVLVAILVVVMEALVVVA